MVNTEEITKRIEVLLEYYGLSSAAFADKINVQRSSISHLLSGRNKPSLEFVLKITNAFPEVDLYWLLDGRGKFPANNQEALFENSEIPPKEKAEIPRQKAKIPIQRAEIGIEKEAKFIQRIVILYSDGSFETYQENK